MEHSDTDYDSKAAFRSQSHTCGGVSQSRSSSIRSRASSSDKEQRKIGHLDLEGNTNDLHESLAHRTQKQRLHPTTPPPSQRRNQGNPLHTPPYIYTPSTPPDTDTTSCNESSPRSQHSKQRYDFLTPAPDWDRIPPLELCEDEFDLRVRGLREAARSLAAVRAVEQACILRDQKIHMRRQRCLKRALELADACFLSDEEREVGAESEIGKKRRAGDERTQRQKTQWTIQQAQETYERNWEMIVSSNCPLSFSSIPWPVLTRPSGPSSMTQAEVASFIFGDLKTVAAAADRVKRKERVKGALRRWHPDKFARYVERVGEGEREAVLEAAGNVVRGLNEML